MCHIFAFLDLQSGAIGSYFMPQKKKNKKEKQKLNILYLQSVFVGKLFHFPIYGVYPELKNEKVVPIGLLLWNAK